jgi:threonine dehydrogenase-like Zn-dependent dehydrogenase
LGVKVAAFGYLLVLRDLREKGLQAAAVENGIVHLHKVAVIRDFGEQVEVNSGLKQGDRVMLNPAVDLAEGAKCKRGRRPC